ncbi:curlin [Bradyrhizobium centrolobii]|uniref:Curlin n=1 Tax=Bradyrhizobium centrolobii TaxID=1505087 RepID=A0A176Z463_9BRAD|nr:curlin [Bradyrhizobium centrolobii]OAF14233.1 curlin [Bradyrhizobium centrolobii]
MKYRLPAAAGIAALIACCVQGTSAQAQTFDFKNIVSVGGPPVVVNQSSQFNMTGLFMVGGNTSGTVVQTGTTNAVGILQFGGTTSASISQTGTFNSASVGQTGQSATSLLSQLGTMNSGSIAQFSAVNSSTVIQKSP